MGYDGISTRTANKMRAVFARGLPTQAGRTTGGGTPRYDTHVIVTGPMHDAPDSDSDSADSDGPDLSGFWPGRPTYYNPVEDFWVEFDECLVIPSNGGELFFGEDRRYRAICYGEFMGLLVFAVDECCGQEDSDSDSDDSGQTYSVTITTYRYTCSDGNLIETPTSYTITSSSPLEVEDDG